MHQNGLARLELGIVEQHVLGGAEGDRRAGGVAQRHAGRHRDHQPRRQIDQIAREAVDVEAHDAADVLAQIIAALAAGGAMPAGHGAVHHHLVAGLEAGDAGADRGDFAGCLGADHQRQLALGEGHAAKAPQVEMIERDRLDADLHLAVAGRRRSGTSASSSLRSAMSRKARMAGVERARPLGRLAPHHQRDVLPAETE